MSNAGKVSGTTLLKKRAVIKFGGADLSTPEGVKRAAQMAIDAPYLEKIIVVSAMGKTTDNLLELVTKTSGEANGMDYAEVVSMGERTSARVFCTALKSLGAKACFFDPAGENWPIITNTDFIGAEVDIASTRELAMRHIAPLLDGCIPVVCGFVGKSPDGDITTLGRGGSDTTAILLASVLQADEVILVKKTDGIMSADPRVVPSARMIPRLTVHEMFALARGGAQIVCADALRYKSNGVKLRIVNFDTDNLADGGTEVVGNFDVKKAEVSSRENLSALTIVCRNETGTFGALFDILSRENVNVLGISTGLSSFTVFLDGFEPGLLEKVHANDRFNAVSLKGSVGMLSITHPDFIHLPGYVSRIASILAGKKINIIEITTDKSTISVFVDMKQLATAATVISDGLEI